MKSIVGIAHIFFTENVLSWKLVSPLSTFYLELNGI